MTKTLQKVSDTKLKIKSCVLLVNNNKYSTTYPQF